MSLIGRWVSSELPCFAYNFGNDGKGCYSMWDKQKDFSYYDGGGSVTIHFVGDARPSSFDYFIEDDTLYISDSFGNTVVYKKE